MQIIYVCPKCGADLIDSVITTNPPRARKECSKCDWYWEEEPEDVVRIPFEPPGKRQEWPEPVDPWKYVIIPDCCLNCLNHPSNGGSGICNCVLPYMTYTKSIPKGTRLVYWMNETHDNGTYTEYSFGAGDAHGNA